MNEWLDDNVNVTPIGQQSTMMTMMCLLTSFSIGNTFIARKTRVNVIKHPYSFNWIDANAQIHMKIENGSLYYDDDDDDLIIVKTI